MTIRPILMSTSMVQAAARQINYGAGKTQTRRVVTSGTTTWDGGAWPQHLRGYRLYKSDHSWIDHSFPGEKQNGQVPDGHCLKCLDGDKTNTDPANWQCIPRAILPRLNARWHGIKYDDAELEVKPAVMAIARLDHAIKSAQDHKKERI